jgi:hypothetical protein
MEAIAVSAKFAAYTWFTETATGKHASQQEAARFAEENWGRFLAFADKGFGLLLIRLGKRRPASKGRGSRRREAA